VPLHSQGGRLLRGSGGLTPMPRITKGQIAAAYTQLACIYELGRENGWDAACYQFHANSANNAIATLEKAGKDLPEWLLKDWRCFKVLGWRGDFIWRIQASLPTSKRGA
jgi:hypothetical protein